MPKKKSKVKKQVKQSNAAAHDSHTAEIDDDDDDDDEVDANDNELVVEVKKDVRRSVRGLIRTLQGAKLDSLIVLLVTSAIIPIFKRLNTSPIVGFLLTGTLMGPTGLNWVRDIHLIDVIGTLAVGVFVLGIMIIVCSKLRCDR